MSSLIFHTDAHQALVVTDTLAVDLSGTPMFFVSKAHVIPHLNVIIAGTGVGGFADEWSALVNKQFLVRGVDNLDFHTSKALRGLWNEFDQDNRIAANHSTTIYHFGVSEEDGTIHSYAYRSTSNFETEALGYGTGVKPECEVPEGNLVENIRGMMEEQRRNQATHPAEERIYIGGSAYAIYLSADGYSITKLFDFPDLARDYAIALSGLENER